MAKMIPDKPRSFSVESLEDIMFSSLEKLPDDYYVIHSFRNVTVTSGKLIESETDFLIFNQKKGILCLEAKAGHIKYENGEWMYSSGIKMSHDGPYNQASRNKWVIKDMISETRYRDLLERCKLLHAVWFPSISESEFDRSVFPPEASKDITLLSNDLSNPLPHIERIFNLCIGNNIQTNLSDSEADVLIRRVLCPSFDLAPSVSFENDIKKQVFLKLLNEQKNILNFLSYQKTCTVQGSAGTGKTLIALEKARRNADDGHKVLFLCFNRYLNEFISENNPHTNIDYYTIDGFACKICGTRVANYKMLKEKLESFYENNSFPYDHVIIDEGQDFGQNEIEENDILALLEMNVIERIEDGSFYIFFDPLQFVQGMSIPSIIQNSDCKITLYRNCRNTEEIARTSMKPFKTKQIKMMESSVKGTVPKLYYFDEDNSIETLLVRAITDLEQKGIKDIIILTCKTEQTSQLSSKIKNGKFLNKYSFTTCRKFKGLEADGVILTDVDSDTLTTDAARVYYVGASRARISLSLIVGMSDEDAKLCLLRISDIVGVRNPKKMLASELNTIVAK